MKLIKILASLVAAATLMVGCAEEETYTRLDEVQVSSSYISIPVAGGQSTMEITANDSWTIDGIPSWLTVNPTSGSKGKSTVTFSAENALDGRNATVKLKVGGAVQNVNVIQGLPTVSPATCADIIAGPDSKTYLVTGVCTGIYNTQYGNWFLNDGTGEITIYGTLDAKGNTKNFLSLGLEVGDIVTVQGPKTTYGTTIELVDVTVVKIEKSLIKVDSLSTSVLPVEGGEVKAWLMCKGNGVNVSVPEDAKSWLSIQSIQSGAAPEITFAAAPNMGGDRSTTITFTTIDDKKKEYTAQATIEQKGAIIPATAAEVNAAADGSIQYRVSGYISDIVNDIYGNFNLVDYTGSAYIYGTLDAAGKTKNFASLGISAGDIVTVVGPKGSYKGSPQMVNVSVEKHYPVTKSTVADFVGKEDNAEVYFQLTGKVENLKDGDLYGNFDLVDETGSVYVYGVVAGFGGPKKEFQKLGIKNGDIVTIVGVHSSYKGATQVASAFFVSKEEGQEEEPGEVIPGELPYTISLGANAWDDGLATINGVENTNVWKIGTSSKVGDIVLTIPAGVKTFSFYAVSWKGTETSISLTLDTNNATTIQEVRANDGATGNSPYTITATEDDHYSFTADFPEETKVTISSEKRIIFWGFAGE